MTRFTIFAVSVAIAGFAVATHSINAQSATPAVPVAQQSTPQPAMTPMSGMPQDAQMKAMHEKMMADMKTADAKLDGLVTKMNAASGTAKVDAIGETISEMVRQHKAMHQNMMQMQDQMMMQMHGSMAMPMGTAK